MSAPIADAIGADSAQTFETLRTKSPAGGTLRTSHSRTVAPERVSGAQSVVRSLEELGVDVVFGIPGGAILPAYDPLLDSQKVRHILVRHEQGAGHAATGYAQIAGRAGVMMATSGPGATNLVTPLADAQMDSVPVVAITGQVGRALIGTDAFQEADISGITMPITKHNFLISNAADIPRVMAEAFYLAESGRPGAVLVDIPKDILQAQTTFSWPPQMDLPGYRPVTKPHGKQVREAARMILASMTPVLYVGGGVLKANAAPQLKELAELTGIPVVTTLMARGAFPDSHPLHIGMPGMHGAVAAVAGLQRSDLLITLGARFDDRVTGKVPNFAPHAKIIHADIDPAELGKVRRPDVPIVGDCRLVIEELVRVLRDRIADGLVGDAVGDRVGADLLRRVAVHHDNNPLPSQVLRDIGERVPQAGHGVRGRTSMLARGAADALEREREGAGICPDFGGVLAKQEHFTVVDDQPNEVVG